MITKIIVCLFAGMGAGLGTGFAGLSAAAVISPMLLTFLGVPAYEAIGIALASDVLASAASAYTYGKSRNLDIRNGLVMLVTVLIFTLLGSLVSKEIPDTSMGNFSVIMPVFIGLKFIIKPVMATKESRSGVSKKKQVIQSIVCGIIVGLICGTIGAGGGMMMLFVLTMVLGYELKTAVGTSVFIMTFTALTGAASHFVIGGKPDILLLVLCMLFTLIFAKLGAGFANKSKPELLNRVTGVILVILGITMLIVKNV